MRRNLSLIAALVLFGGCQGNGPHEVLTEVPAGTWGGQGVVMLATDSSAGFRFNCASGSVDGPLALDAGGRFTWSGTYTRMSPLPGSPPDPPHAATFYGTTDGLQLTMALTVPDLSLESAPLTLTLGDPGNLALCP
jgi:hypothetical protein